MLLIVLVVVTFNAFSCVIFTNDELVNSDFDKYDAIVVLKLDVCR